MQWIEDQLFAFVTAPMPGDLFAAAADDHLLMTEIVVTPTEGEFISEDASLEVAIHQLIMVNNQSLLVTRDKKIVGILRLTDVFAVLFHKMKECFMD